MYIKSIVLEGFKSYGQRTEITGFDNLFNAITGLNGTGKSNILDAICFVLGITNLSHVRAANLQDLVYKSGQDGLNKATVSITFDNTNPVQSPPGFESCEEINITRQIVIGGKNKYLINGINATNKKVQDLFCSVQLNVNNPNFVIMQGKITKVLNMKSEEILAMIEESAGTRNYEIKKQQCQKTLDKKNAKLAEITAALKDELLPKLEKLREQRAQYSEYQRIDHELQQMTGIYNVWHYYSAQKNFQNAEKALQDGNKVLDEIKHQMEVNKTAVQEKNQQIDELMKNKKSSANDTLQLLNKQLKEKEKIAAKSNAERKSIENNIESEEKNIKKLEKNINDDEKQLKAKQDELNQLQNMFDTLKMNETKDREEFMRAQKKFEALSAGMEVNDDGEAETLQEQLMKAETEASEANTEFKQATQQIKHYQELLRNKEKEFMNTSNYDKDKGDLQRLEKDVKHLENKLSSINFNENHLKNLMEKKRTIVKEIEQLNDQIDLFETQRPYTKFSYRDPETNFNRNRVNGIVCRLIKCTDEKACTALETAAGRMLYDVVVDTDVTSKKLLQYGNLKQRTTFIPLNKIQSRKMNNRVVQIAQELVGNENCRPALSLINYEPVVAPAMEFILGNVFICKDMNVAKVVAFDERIRRKCVTLDGDVCDPAGTLSGGARQKGQSILAQIQQIKQLEENLRLKKEELKTIENEFRKLTAIQEDYSNLKQNLDMKSHELTIIKQRVQNTKYHKLQQEINDLKRQIDELNAKMKVCQERSMVCNQKSKDLANKIKNAKGHRENMLKEAENDMKRWQKKAEKSKQDWIEKEENYETLKLEITELENGVENTKQEIVKIRENIEKLKNSFDDSNQDKNQISDEIKAIEEQINETKAIITAQSAEIIQIEKEKDKLIEDNNNLELNLRQQQHTIKKLQDDLKSAKYQEQNLLKHFNQNEKYIEKAKSLTDKEGLDLERKIQVSQERKTALGRIINPRVHSTFQQEEEEYNEMDKKIRQIHVDKKNILEIIRDLDKKKKDSLKLAYEQISKDFGSIFSTLLPDAYAKLVAPFGKTFLEGLEIKVSLGGVWKESLTELSGGQRSLAALSLILAMLLFKPAPIYILDEVDAALDLSHTQNIGAMLRSHFKKSQFIIVSLKDGMFNNANVLFRTSFVDGVSAVSRTVNSRRN